MNQLKHNLIKIYFFNFTMMFLVTIPIIVPYWKQFGLTLKEVYLLQAVFGFMMIILDVPAGYISDLFGRKHCLIAVGFINIFSYQFLLHGKNFFGFVLFEICAALAYSLYSGCDIAMIYDTLDAIGEKKNEITYLGKRVFYGQLGETIASFLGGMLAAYSLSLPVKINAITACLPFLIALTLVEPPRKKLDHQNHLKNIQFIFKSLFKHSSLLSLLIIFNIFYGFATFAAVWSYQTYWETVKIPIAYFGYLWAFFNLIVALTARVSSKVESKINAKWMILFIGICPIIAYLGLWLNKTEFGVILIIFFSISRAFNSVIIQNLINVRVPASMRATTNSFCSLGMRAIFFVAAPLIGSALDTEGVHATYKIMGIAYVILFFVIVIPLYLQKKAFRLQQISDSLI